MPCWHSRNKRFKVTFLCRSPPPLVVHCRAVADAPRDALQVLDIVLRELANQSSLLHRHLHWLQHQLRALPVCSLGFDEEPNLGAFFSVLTYVSIWKLQLSVFGDGPSPGTFWTTELGLSLNVGELCFTSSCMWFLICRVAVACNVLIKAEASHVWTNDTTHTWTDVCFDF
jgi:hypothetical protein